MIRCPNCQQEEVTGALYCTECGAQLFVASSPIKNPAADEKPQSGDAPLLIEFQVMGHPEVFSISGIEEFILGRSGPDQPIMPDLDLTPCLAYEAGVSRLHASIRVQQGQLSVVDLGSANGTRLNGVLLPPHAPAPMQSGDILTLGKLKILVSVVKQA